MSLISEPVMALPQPDGRMLFYQGAQCVLNFSIVFRLQLVMVGGGWQLHYFTGLIDTALRFLGKKMHSLSFINRPWNFFAISALAASS